jgi:hypothetical protein
MPVCLQFRELFAYEHDNPKVAIAVEGALTALMKKMVGAERVVNLSEGNGKYMEGAPMYTVAITVFMPEPLKKAGYKIHKEKRAC